MPVMAQSYPPVQPVQPVQPQSLLANINSPAHLSQPQPQPLHSQEAQSRSLPKSTEPLPAGEHTDDDHEEDELEDDEESTISQVNSETLFDGDSDGLDLLGQRRADCAKLMGWTDGVIIDDNDDLGTLALPPFPDLSAAASAESQSETQNNEPKTQQSHDTEL